MTTRLLLVVLVLVVGGVVSQQDSASSSVVDDNNDDNDSSQQSSSVFTPTVTAICTRTKIVITTQTSEPFFGVVTSRGLRNNTACFKEGNGATTTVLEIDSSSSAPTAPSDPDYCRVSTNPTTSEKSVQISVRQHKTLELAHDKNYLVSCNKLTSSSPPLTPLPATLYLSTSSSGPNLKEVINARAYKLILKTNHPHYQIKNCVAFGSHSDSATTFFDSLGCPVSRITSKWTSLTPTTSETNIFQMFRFQDNNQVTLQCTVTFCQQGPPCNPPTPTCNNDVTDDDLFYHPTNPQPLIANSTSSSVIASTTVNVLNPGDPLSHPLNLDDGSVCTGRFCPLWLLYLAITLGVLFLLMLLVNLCLCTALTCTCTRTELIEKDPSILEDYDPYNNSSHQRAWEPYSTSNKPFTESLASADHYATPNNNGGGRPDSRFSQHKK